MKVIPIIELQGRNCVTLSRGSLDEPQIWHADPVAKAREFAAAGAEWLHVTDLDAVAGQGETNADIIEDIIRQVGIPVQVAGGIRSDERVRHWYDLGAGRMVIGTGALKHPDWVKALAKHYPDQIVLGVDVYQGRVVVEGWRKTTAFTPEDFVHAFDGVPLAAIAVTDIDYDLDLKDASFALTTKLADETRTPVISSGLVRTLDDISTLKYVRNVWGCLVGRALFAKDIDLAEAIETARPEPEPVAQFK